MAGLIEKLKKHIEVLNAQAKMQNDAHGHHDAHDHAPHTPATTPP